MKKKLLVCVMALASVAAVTGCEKKENKNEDTTTTTTAAAVSKLSCVLTEGKDRTTLSYYYKDGAVYKTSYTETKSQKDDKTAKSKKEAFAEKMPELNKNKGLSTSTSNSGTLYTFSYNFTLADMDEKTKEIYNEYFSETDGKSYEEIKTILETATFKCS